MNQILNIFENPVLKTSFFFLICVCVDIFVEHAYKK